MPVTRLAPEDIVVQGWDRLSASKIGAWKSCPRQYWMQYHQKIREPLPSVIVRGNAVESCISRVLRESPALISAQSPDRILVSPLDEKGNLIEGEDGWIGPSLEKIPENERPTDLESLSRWAHSRIDAHVERCTNDALMEWLLNPHRIGDENDLNRAEIVEMAHRGMDLHLEEVKICHSNLEKEELQKWRKGGQRDTFPAPDGFSNSGEHVPPEVSTGSMTWSEAWAIARPWFVDPDAPSFSMQTIHPEQWFQGEYDLVYRWNGKIRIIDLKASIGNNDRSRLYSEQLRLYSWLWWETHDREDIVEGLEIWYLGPGKRKIVDAPDENELILISKEMEEIYQILSNVKSEDDAPLNPSPVYYFEEGGVQIGTAENPTERCKTCPYVALCPQGGHDASLPNNKTAQVKGRDLLLTPVVDVVTRVDLEGEIFTVPREPKLQDGGVIFQFELRQGLDNVTVKNAWNTAPKNVTRSLRKGVRVRVREGLPSLWRGKTEISIDQYSSVERSEGPKPTDIEIIEIHPRVNVVGRVWSVESQKGPMINGTYSDRWSITMIDKTGVINVVGFKMNVPDTASGVNRGDIIAIINAEPGEFARRKQVKCIPGTSILRLQDNENLPNWKL